MPFGIPTLAVIALALIKKKQLRHIFPTLHFSSASYVSTVHLPFLDIDASLLLMTFKIIHFVHCIFFFIVHYSYLVVLGFEDVWSFLKLLKKSLTEVRFTC